jgi:hypothetical protein
MESSHWRVTVGFKEGSPIKKEKTVKVLLSGNQKSHQAMPNLLLKVYFVCMYEIEH